MSILNTTGDLYPSPGAGEKPKSKIDFGTPAAKASGKSKNPLVGSDYNTVPLPSAKKSNERGFTVSPKLAPMDKGRKVEKFGPGSDMSSY